MKTKTVRRHPRGLIGLALVTLAAIQPLRGDGQDDRIERAFTDTYVYHTQLKNDDITIESEDRVVTLDGRVSNDREKQLAGDTAAGLPGVMKVNNNLEIYPPPPERSDRWIALRVRAALLFHRNVSLADKKVAVSNGVVTLTGTAASEAERELAVQYAAAVRGVKSVVDQMQIPGAAPESTPTIGARIDDAAMTAQLKYQLATHRATSALRTEVSTRDGVVTIQGQAANGAEKDLVTHLAQSIKGVKAVRNEMQVQG